MSNEQKLEVVRNFMSSTFPGFAIQGREEADRYRFELLKDDSKHVILVSKQFLDACEAHDIPTRLSNYSIALVAQNLGDLPILVTTNGCIFDRDLL
jgi:hypothetical protein